MGYRKDFEKAIKLLEKQVKKYYGDKLVSLAIFGSVARGTFRPDSDIDFLIVAHHLPRGRVKRIKEFISHVETPWEKKLKECGISLCPELSPLIKTPEEVTYGSPVFLDMTEEVLILYDEGDFLKNYLAKLKERLKALGAVKKRLGGGWYWVLKPDYRPGDIIEL